MTLNNIIKTGLIVGLIAPLSLAAPVQASQERNPLETKVTYTIKCKNATASITYHNHYQPKVVDGYYGEIAVSDIVSVSYNNVNVPRVIGSKSPKDDRRPAWIVSVFGQCHKEDFVNFKVNYQNVLNSSYWFITAFEDRYQTTDLGGN